MDRTINNGKIYVLKDPINGSIRYVGKFEGKDLKKRLATHVYEAFGEESNNHRVNWIRYLFKSHRLYPIIELIQDGYTSRVELCEAEKFLIQFFKDIGLDLVNGTIGGDGGDTRSGKIASPETLEKQIKANLHRAKKIQCKETRPSFL